MMENGNEIMSLIDNADSFSKRFDEKSLEFGWANVVNLAFAVELYLKSIMEFEKGKIERGHNLKQLFNQLSEEAKISIYNNWRMVEGSNIHDNDQIKEWFNDNLYACCDVFQKFRYVHEWAGCHVSLETSWNEDQWEKLSPMSAKREFGKLQVHDGFLYEFENAIKKHIKEIIIPKLPRPSHDIEIAFRIEATNIR